MRVTSDTLGMMHVRLYVCLSTLNLPTYSHFQISCVPGAIPRWGDFSFPFDRESLVNVRPSEMLPRGLEKVLDPVKGQLDPSAFSFLNVQKLIWVP